MWDRQDGRMGVGAQIGQYLGHTRLYMYLYTIKVRDEEQKQTELWNLQEGQNDRSVGQAGQQRKQDNWGDRRQDNKADTKI